ncbi:MAG TPA: hypothetical protein VKY81_10145 [Natronosporangium sp.]|nr:hypothetical protein [Natronosporangium sp.]
MTTGTHRPATAPPRPPVPVRAVVRTMLREQRWLALTALLLPVAAGAITLLVRAFADVDGSVWEPGGTALRWMMLVVGATATPLYLPTYVAHGVTRRRFTVAATLAAGGLAAAAAAYLAAGLLVERVLSVAGGAGAPRLANAHLFDSTGQVHLVVAEYGLAFLAYLVTGWLLGSVYYRYGGWRGTLLVPLALVPLAAVEVLINAVDELAGLLGTGPHLAVPLAAGLGLAVVAAGLLAVRVVVRDAPVRPATGR